MALPPNFRIESELKFQMDMKQCQFCKFERSFNMRWTCIKYVVYVRSKNTCDSWEDGHAEFPVLNKYEEPTEDEEAFLKSSLIEDLRKLDKSLPENDNSKKINHQ